MFVEPRGSAFRIGTPATNEQGRERWEGKRGQHHWRANNGPPRLPKGHKGLPGSASSIRAFNREKGGGRELKGGEGDGEAIKVLPDGRHGHRTAKNVPVEPRLRNRSDHPYSSHFFLKK